MSVAPVAPETPGIGDLQSVPVRHTADRRGGRNRDIRGRNGDAPGDRAGSTLSANGPVLLWNTRGQAV